jgi:hypothetical protein
MSNDAKKVQLPREEKAGWQKEVKPPRADARPPGPPPKPSPPPANKSKE